MLSSFVSFCGLLIAFEIAFVATVSTMAPNAVNAIALRVLLGFGVIFYLRDILLAPGMGRSPKARGTVYAVYTDKF